MQTTGSTAGWFNAAGARQKASENLNKRLRRHADWFSVPRLKFKFSINEHLVKEQAFVLAK